MILKQSILGGVLLAGLAGLAHAEPTEGMPTPASAPGSRISFAPLPIQLYLQPGDKPTVAFVTPCIEMEKASHGFPPFLAFETFMFKMIGNMNDTNVLPMRFEPVCT